MKISKIECMVLSVGFSLGMGACDFSFNAARADHLNGTWSCVKGETAQGGQMQAGMEAQLQVQGDNWRGGFQHIGYGQFQANGVVRTGPADNGGEFVIFQAVNSSNPQAIGLANFGVVMLNSNLGRNDYGSVTEICQRR